MNKEISIIIPSYNQGNFLEETLRSIISENGLIEICLVDGGSLDASLDIIEQYNQNLTFWVSEKDRGQSHAINKGLEKSTGTIINWINSDDFLEPGATLSIKKAFSDKRVNVFIGQSNIVRDGVVIRKSRGSDVYWGNLAKTIGQARIDQPEHWWRKSVIDNVGALNEALHYTMDRDWWVKYLLRYGLNGIKKESVVLANFRLHGDSKTVSQSEQFNQERNSYYRSLALHYGFDDHANQLAKLAGARNVPMTNLPDQIDLDTLNDSFNYFFLLLADEAYVTGDHGLVRDFLKIVDKKALQEEDQAFANKLNFRSRFPSSLIEFARRWKK